MTLSDVFESWIVKTDITAVKFVYNHIFAGIGNVLHIFDSSGKELCRKKIFSSHRIHGINPQKDMVAINGNRSVRIISLNQLKCDITFKSNEWMLNDWIWETRWQINEDEILILTGHNSLSLHRWKDGQMLKHFTCDVRCIIYCGQITGTTLENTVVLSGTVFKQIIVWTPNENVIHRLSGHKGAIFSIHYNDTVNRISSTSDDRSIRIWQVRYKYDEKKLSNAHIDLLLTIYGHISRVWRSLILNCGKIISAGEDSQLRIWDENGEDVKHWETHQNGSIWCMDYSDNLKMIITGGKDGAVSCWSLEDDTTSSNCAMLNVEDVSLGVVTKLVITKDEGILAVTEKGNVLYWNNTSWKSCISYDVLKSYSLLEISKDRTRVSLASICGSVIVLEEADFKINEIVNTRIAQEKIYSIQWLTSHILITCLSNGKMEIWIIDENIASLEKYCSITLPPGKERWLTSACLYDFQLLVGDRGGSIYYYKIQKDTNDILSPMTSFRNVHSRLGVSSIYWKNSLEAYSIGRDGFLRCWNLIDNLIYPSHVDKLMLPWPVRILFDKNIGLLVLGFNELNFEIWSFNEKRQLMTHSCGGGHRSWDLICNDNIKFVYIKNKVVNALSIPFNIFTKPIVEGYHVRDINTARFLNSNILVSGGEDTTIRISELNKMDVNTKCIIRSHISSVRCIDVLPIRDYYILVSAGGRALIKIWKISNKGTLKHTELCTHMLREDDRRHRRPWRSNKPILELEPRYMDINISNDVENIIAIYAASSDGIWRLFNFNEETRTLTLLKSYEYHDHCILKIVSLKWNNVRIVITMTTDGKGTFWNLNDDIPIISVTLHQSGVNGFSYLLKDDKLVLATGGDDTALVVSTFQLNDDGIRMYAQKRLENVHGSQITGVKLLQDFIITTSVDQKIILWRIKNEDVIENIEEYNTVIPDIHGITTTVNNKRDLDVIVYGTGFELLTIKL